MFLYKYRDFVSPFWKRIFEYDCELWFSIAEHLDDEEEVSVESPLMPIDCETQGFVDQMRNGVSILSLSRTFSSSDCWSCYGDSKKGFCIEIDFSTFETEDGSYQISEVDYISEPAKVTFNIANLFEYRRDEEGFIEKTRRRLFYEKNLSWCAQEETRIMHYNLSPPAAYNGFAKSFGIENIKNIYVYSEFINENEYSELKLALKTVKERFQHEINIVEL